MELRELAERILFGTSLDDKLSCPETISDERPGDPVHAPIQPGRPCGLAFKPTGTGEKADFPGLHQLEQREHRGRLLHFFANHELLATELMALVLLKFPEAPRAFRQGVLRTLRDEQEHTRRYLERMRACGVNFGELPVSGYFWRAISGMEHPMDYVAGLSLTFEQANLDFCRHFARGFASVGDLETSALLDQIHKDEIAHVAYGLKWFRKWKNPSESDWDAYCRQLRFPLSPSRAKGAPLNWEGRRAAGLDDDFIQRLSVHAQSKGRTPRVFWFNPLSEAFMAQGPSFTPVKAQAQLVRDLENLPQFLARRDDLILVERMPSLPFLQSLQAAGFELPEFAQVDSARGLVGHVLTERKLGSLHPWAWGPDSVRFLEPLLHCVTAPQGRPHHPYQDDLRRLYGKQWSAEFLRQWLQTWTASHPNANWIGAPDIVGVAVNSWENLLTEIKRIRASGHHRVVLKQSLGLAGQNALRLWEPDWTPEQERWARKSLDQGRVLVVEPWQERVADYSIQLEMKEGRLRLCGFTGLLNDLRGQFCANWVAPQFAKRPPLQIIHQITGMDPDGQPLQDMHESLLTALEAELLQFGFEGPLGIDAFLYRCPQSGRVRVKPVVEINPRFTMGRVLVELMRVASPGRYGRFQLVNASQLRASGHSTFRDYAKDLTRRHPQVVNATPRLRMDQGVVCLNDPEVAASALALFQVSPDHKGLM